VQASEALFTYGVISIFDLPPACTLLLNPKTSWNDKCLNWIRGQFGYAPIFNERIVTLNEPDVSALPVFLRLLEDDSPIVRYWAAQNVGYFGDSGRIALPGLYRLIQDDTTVASTNNKVSDAAKGALWLMQRMASSK